ncbi:MAG: heavy-metal-associated domain-containing protein [Bacteroidales bacterium]
MKRIVKFVLDGSTCRYCAQTLKNHFSKMEGVEGIEIDFSQGSILIEYQSDTDRKNQFQEAFSKLGYSCQGDYVRKIDSCC